MDSYYSGFDMETEIKSLIKTDSIKVKQLYKLIAYDSLLPEPDQYYLLYRAFSDPEFSNKYFLFEKCKKQYSYNNKLFWKSNKLSSVAYDWEGKNIKRGSMYDHSWDDFSTIKIWDAQTNDSILIQCFEEESFTYMNSSVLKPVMCFRNNTLLSVVNFENFSVKSINVGENNGTTAIPDATTGLIKFIEPGHDSKKEVIDQYYYFFDSYAERAWDYNSDIIYDLIPSQFHYVPSIQAQKAIPHNDFLSTCKKNKEVASYLKQWADVNHLGYMTGTPLTESIDEGRMIQLISENECVSPTVKGYMGLFSYPGMKSTKSFYSPGIAVKTGFIPSTNFIFMQNTDGTIFFFNKKEKDRSGPAVSLNVSSKGLIFLTHENYYMVHGKLDNFLYFNVGNTTYPFEQFDLKYNRPDKVLEKFECKDSLLIASYKKAYLKRLRKMNFTEEMLKDDFHLPELEIDNIATIPVVTESRELTLSLFVRDSKYKLDRLKFYINDVAIFGSNGIDLRNESGPEVKWSGKITLAEGKNRVQVSVLNQVGAESYKKTIFVTYKPKSETKPNLYLVTIGVSKYKDNRYDLTYAAKDAEDIKTFFLGNANYENVFTYSFTNKDVSRENILKLKEELKKSQRDDIVIITVAGHGVLDKDLNYYLATYDIDFDNPSGKGLAYEELESLLDGIAPLKKVLFIDACHSGEVDKEEVEQLAVNASKGDITFRAAGAGIQKKNLSLKTTSELMGELFTDLRRGTGATVISSAGGVELAMESAEWKNGLFTYCLLHGLQDQAADLNKDGQVMLSELQQYLRTEVTQLSQGAQQPTSRIENLSMDFRIW